MPDWYVQIIRESSFIICPRLIILYCCELEAKPNHNTNYVQAKYGIVGVNPFCKLSKCGFDPTHSFVTDTMHCFFLGCVKTLASLHFFQKFAAFPFNLRSKIGVIDKRIKLIAKLMPHEFERPPRSLQKNFVHYKGMTLMLSLIYLWKLSLFMNCY